MDKKIIWRLTIVVASFLLMGYFLVDSVVYYAKPLEQREEYVKTHPNILKRIVNLGLDLQGGMRLVLEIDRSKLEKEQQKKLLDRAYTVIENRINKLGVAEPTIQKQGQDRIIVELPGLKDEKRAKEIIGQTAQLEFMLLREPVQLEKAISVIDNVLAGKALMDSSIATAAKDTVSEKEKEKQVLAEKLFKGADNTTDTTAKSAIKDSAKTMTVEELAKASSFKEFLVSVQDQLGVRMDNVERVKAILGRTDVREALERSGLGGNVFLWSHDTTKVEGKMFRSLYYLKAAPEMTGEAIKTASPSIDQGFRAGAAKVDMEMDARGARRFAAVTGRNVNKFLAIVLDSTVYSAPRIIQKIPLGRAEITGSFTMEEAKNLAIVLEAGALPAPVTIIEERTVGPSLGQDSIEKSIKAGIIGGLLVIIFMIFYYRLCGVIAVVLVILNVFGILAVMAGLNATLTLPGIAGIILQIGMGVDANVLIFERIREELRLGKTVRSAIEAGFNRAFVTIVDSNLTTIVTALIILWKGTGALRGFALTLIFGLTISLFLALFVSRVVMDIMFKKNVGKMSI
ncbi:MAG: protein translocase subunit SecD [Chitinispirillaceae bacterium]|nr:protein translocase subunit SecD [Chitinispirillaceae bacterium]